MSDLRAAAEQALEALEEMDLGLTDNSIKSG